MATDVGQEAAGAGAGEEPVDVRNWFGDLDWEAGAVAEARSVEDIVAVMRDTDKYPSPVRARGSGHSTTVCGVADGGTVINMKPMSRILDIGTDTVTAEAGAMLIDVAKELEQRGLQFYVNIELGNATIGSLACCATKDASMPGEFGQANSYCVAMKMVTPSGEILEVDESDPGLLQAARSSYGLFGVVYEATFKVQPLQAMQVEHKSFKLDEYPGEAARALRPRAVDHDVPLPVPRPNLCRVAEVHRARRQGGGPPAASRSGLFATTSGRR